jgi:hypothetical protein
MADEQHADSVCRPASLLVFVSGEPYARLHRHAKDTMKVTEQVIVIPNDFPGGAWSGLDIDDRERENIGTRLHELVFAPHARLISEQGEKMEHVL